MAAKPWGNQLIHPCQHIRYTDSKWYLMGNIARHIHFVVWCVNKDPLTTLLPMPSPLSASIQLGIKMAGCKVYTDGCLASGSAKVLCFNEWLGWLGECQGGLEGVRFTLDCFTKLTFSWGRFCLTSSANLDL